VRGKAPHRYLLTGKGVRYKKQKRVVVQSTATLFCFLVLAIKLRHLYS